MLQKLFAGAASHNPELSASAKNEELERYQRIFKGSRGYGFLDWDLENQQATWFGGFWPHLGYSMEDINRIQDIEDFLSFMHEDDREIYRQALVRMVKGETVDEILVRARKVTGVYVWVEIRLTAVRDSAGRATHLSGVVFDISALKEAEEALRVSEARHARIIQGSNDGIWEWSAKDKVTKVTFDKEGSIEWQQLQQGGGFTFSHRCWEMLGYNSVDDVVKSDLAGWRQLMHPEDGKRFDSMLINHVTKGTAFDIEYRIRGKEGDWRWIRGRGQMSYDENGRPDTLSGTNMDITELKRSEERVMQAKVEAENASLAKSQFLSSMSHELRTPLNAILGFAQLMELDVNLSKEQKDNAREITMAGQHLLELVGDVLDLAKIEAGHLKLSLERVLPSRVINECINLLREQLEKRDLSLDVEFNRLHTHAVYADQMRLKQVFINLIGNAIKYNRTGGKVKVEAMLLENGEIRVQVSDTGQGIPERLQSELFQPFNRLGAERSGIEGSGVGLVITKQLVEQMGGKIGFKSTDGVGSSFWVDFSIAGDDLGASEQRGSIDTTKVIITEDVPKLLFTKTKNILYVEDNPSNQKLMKQVLGKYAKIDLTVVGLAVQGLYLARSTNPDLVILDVNLPGVSGFEIVEILKKDPKTQSIPVVALSANVLSHDIERGKRAGFDRYLTKPLNLAELITTCNELLES